jgi:hypothetical protein
MIECNGTHVITHRHKHGNSVYRCTLSNAKKLLDDLLQHDAHGLGELAAELKEEKRPVRPVSWLAKALTEVVEMKESPVRLRMVLFGPGPRERDATDPRPVPVISTEMQDELVLFFFRNGYSLDMLNGRLSPTEPMLEACWAALSFLEPARQRVEKEDVKGVRFIEDVMDEGVDALRKLQNSRWKEDAREERVVGQYVQFFNEWASGTWDVEAVTDL